MAGQQPALRNLFQLDKVIAAQASGLSTTSCSEVRNETLRLF